MWAWRRRHCVNGNRVAQIASGDKNWHSRLEGADPRVDRVGWRDVEETEVFLEACRGDRTGDARHVGEQIEPGCDDGPRARVVPIEGPPTRTIAVQHQTRPLVIPQGHAVDAFEPLEQASTPGRVPGRNECRGLCRCPYAGRSERRLDPVEMVQLAEQRAAGSRPRPGDQITVGAWCVVTRGKPENGDGRRRPKLRATTPRRPVAAAAQDGTAGIPDDGKGSRPAPQGWIGSRWVSHGIGDARLQRRIQPRDSRLNHSGAETQRKRTTWPLQDVHPKGDEHPPGRPSLPRPSPCLRGDGFRLGPLPGMATRLSTKGVSSWLIARPLQSMLRAATHAASPVASLMGPRPPFPTTTTPSPQTTRRCHRRR
jgi:hypothetical protein